MKKETALAEGEDFAEFVGETRRVTLDEVGRDAGAAGEDAETDRTREVLEAVRDGHLSVEDAVDIL